MIEAARDGQVDGANPSYAAQARFELLYPSLRRFAAVVGSRDVDPDDLVQAALEGALRVGAVGTVADLEGYLRQAILRHELNHRRSQGRRRAAISRIRVDRGSEAEYPSDLALLDSLDAGDRALLYLVAVEGRSYSEAASVVGCSAPAARMRATRARRRLRSLLEEADDE